MITPPQTYEMLPAVKSLLEAADVMDFSGYGVLIVADGDQLEIDKGDPLEQPDPAPDGFWWRLVLMRQINGLSEQEQFPDNVMAYPFRVRVDVFPPNGVEFNSEHFLQGVHNLCYHALHYQKVSITDADLLQYIIRKTHPTPAFRDDTKGFRYSAAGYLTGLGPKTN